jgi:hypothetical protein
MGTLSDLAGKSVYLDANVFIYAIDSLSPWNQRAAALCGHAEHPCRGKPLPD